MTTLACAPSLLSQRPDLTIRLIKKTAVRRNQPHALQCVGACYGDCVWETFGSAGFFDGRFVNLRTVATLLFDDDVWRLNIKD